MSSDPDSLTFLRLKIAPDQFTTFSHLIVTSRATSIKSSGNDVFHAMRGGDDRGSQIFGGRFDHSLLGARKPIRNSTTFIFGAMKTRLAVKRDGHTADSITKMIIADGESFVDELRHSLIDPDVFSKDFEFHCHPLSSRVNISGCIANFDHAAAYQYAHVQKIIVNELSYLLPLCSSSRSFASARRGTTLPSGPQDPPKEPAPFRKHNKGGYRDTCV